jgi:UDP-2-acetamido-2-deoxy-ribo-hexuluronate aminotransferase
MKEIQMVDVVSQYNRYSDTINKEILDVIQSGHYIRGEKVSNFEDLLADYLKVNHVVSCGNGTDALQIALMSLGLNRGDEVLVPTFTFVSTVEVVCLLGLVPVFLDVDENTFLLNSSLIESHLSSKTKAIIPVHLFGQCCDMNKIQSIATKYNLFVVEDAAQSIGAKYLNKSSGDKFSGTIGDIGITSFYPSKNLGCFGDGGALFTNDVELADKIRVIANHGQRERYNYELIGVNSRLDAIQAVVLATKLKYLDTFNKSRISSASYYNENLCQINWLKLPVSSSFSTHVFHQYSILLGDDIDRSNFKEYLSSHNIPTMIYYPKPLHKQLAYKLYARSECTVADRISKQIISLPMHSELTLDQIDFISRTIKNFH